MDPTKQLDFEAARADRSTEGSALAAAQAALHADDRSARSQRVVRFLLLSGGLKTTKRTGWVRSGVALPESVADHSHRCALAALLAAPHAGADAARACMVALAHDLAECVCGDITPDDPRGKAEKQRLEEAAMATLGGALRPHAMGEFVPALWREYEGGAGASASPEAALAKDVDKFEMALQALEYERAQPALDLSPFYDSVRGRIRGAEVQAWFDEVLRLRGEMMRERSGGARGAEEGVARARKGPARPPRVFSAGDVIAAAMWGAGVGALASLLVVAGARILAKR
jgi:putative hydrolase of HD superfamily